MIYELHKIYNKMPKYCQRLVLTITIYQATSMSQLHLDFELYPPVNFIENVSSGLRIFLALN